jgi:uroporphyrinogen decarboxylase
MNRTGDFPHIPVVRPAPDAGRFLDILAGRRKGPVPLIEYLVDVSVMKPIVTGMLGRPWVEFGPDRDSQKAHLDNTIEFWRRLGYDFVRFEAGLPFLESKVLAADATSSSGQRAWANEHGGTICSWDDFDRFVWPRVEDFDFFPFEYLAAHRPEGLGLLTCHAGGPFEHLSWIMSLEGLSFALADEPGLVRAVADRIGNLLVDFYHHLFDLPGLTAIFPGDDMGFRSGTLVSPDTLRKYVLPWHKILADMAHHRGLPYFLHSCGNLENIFPDLIESVGIDGKHSFEDAILPIEDVQARWGGRIAVLGGVDINILAEGSEGDVRRRTRRLIETCGPAGRFAVGSGNSIPSYVPERNYLAMIDEAHRLS